MEPASNNISGCGNKKFAQWIDLRDSIRVENDSILLHQARHDLRMKTIGPLSTAIGHGLIFDYFDEVRKFIEPARKDLFFIDPYLDAEFVSRYLPHVAPGVLIRLLARERIATLLPAAETFTKQSNANVQIRSASKFHDRYVLVDNQVCYQSGASFKDGAKSAPTTLTQITDAFEAVTQTYEALWKSAKVERESGRQNGRGYREAVNRP